MSDDIEKPKNSSRNHPRQISFWGEEEMGEEGSKAGNGEGSSISPSVGSLLDSLNPRQKEAVTFPEGPLIILAGPGTGKTMTLAYRIAYRILNEEIAPSSVLAITLTNWAQRELKKELGRLLPDGMADRVSVMTFYSLGLNILREEAGGPGGEAFVVLDDEDGAEFLRMEAREFLTDYSRREIRGLWEEIARAKRELYFPEDLAEGDRPFLYEIYRRYQRGLERIHAFDREDLLLWSVGLLESVPQVREKYSRRFGSLFIDEYQDINYSQYRMIRLLAFHEKSDLTAIGDPDQSIFGFRGSDVRYFLHFDQDYPHARSIYLMDNYRSLPAISRGAQQMIGRSKEEGLAPETPLEQALYLYLAPNEEGEAEFVAHAIKSLVDGNYLDEDEDSLEDWNFSDIAVFYRLSSQVPPLEKALQKAGIPWQRVWKRAEINKPIRALLSALRLLCCPPSNLDITRVLKALTPPWSDEVFHQMKEWAEEKKISRVQAFQSSEFEESLAPDIQKSFCQWKEDLKALGERVDQTSVADLMDRVIGELHLLAPEKDDSLAANLHHLRHQAQSFGQNLRKFLRHQALKTHTDYYSAQPARVSLLPLHAAKGFEFPLVFITGCEEDLIPHLRNDQKWEENWEEELRLFYVGVTRAQKKIFFSAATERKVGGKRQRRELSPFLLEIAPDLLFDIPPLDTDLPSQEEDDQLSLF